MIWIILFILLLPFVVTIQAAKRQSDFNKLPTATPSLLPGNLRRHNLRNGFTQPI